MDSTDGHEAHHDQRKRNRNLFRDARPTKLNDESLPFHGQTTVLVADRKYGKCAIDWRSSRNRKPNHNHTLSCVSVFYRPAPQPEEGSRTRGHPRWYGERFDLKDESTWGSPEEAIQIPHTSQSGRNYTIVIEGWDDLLMRGKRHLPMHRTPFRLIRVRWLTEKGEAAFKRDMWLVVMGQRRGELSLEEIYDSYRQRYDLEHFFRFGKQRLLLDKFQSPDEQREESFIQMVGLAYVELFLARELVTILPRPWERYLPQSASEIASPSQTQRDMERIIGEIGTPAKPPKVRGSYGRRKGKTLDKRTRPPVVKKSKKKRQERKELPKAA